MIILHIEDDMDIREIAKMALEMTGNFTVLQADCGEAGLVIAKDATPDVLLLDVMMPGMKRWSNFVRWTTSPTCRQFI